MARALLQPVLNATGVLLHTNLGRAPIEAHQEARALNLEFDLNTGQRGSRQSHISGLLAQLVKSDDALVVNNCAGALMLALAALASNRSVIVSRGELIEIGGGFRIPDILEASGARLIEVGTTNRTRLSDYESALTEVRGDALILKVHPSNYRMIGFTESVSIEALATLGVPIIADIGSGLIDATTPWLIGGPPTWLADEPAGLQTLEAGATIVTFSGDKLFGGPQAGVIAGDANCIEACAVHPLARTLRVGGLVLAAMQTTAMAYLRRDSNAIPFWNMATVPVDRLRDRAMGISSISGAMVVDCLSVAGGGSVSGLAIPSAGLSVSGDHSVAMRSRIPPVIVRVQHGNTICDLRTIDQRDDLLLASALADTKSSDN